jgi:hypothetical protein
MFPNAGSHIYRNDEGEVIGWDTDYGYEPDPDEFYDSYGDDDGEYDEEPYEEYGDEEIRCEADISGNGITLTRTVVCQWRLRRDGTCPNESSHLTD